MKKNPNRINFRKHKNIQDFEKIFLDIQNGIHFIDSLDNSIYSENLEPSNIYLRSSDKAIENCKISINITPFAVMKMSDQKQFYDLISLSNIPIDAAPEQINGINQFQLNDGRTLKAKMKRCSYFSLGCIMMEYLTPFKN